MSENNFDYKFIYDKEKTDIVAEQFLKCLNVTKVKRQ